MRTVPAMFAAALALAAVARGQTEGEPPAADLMARVGRQVADYYSHARTVLSRETVRLQPLDRQLRPSSTSRRLEYDMRVDWDPMRPGEPLVTRALVEAGGRLATLTGDDAECFDLKTESPEPLSMLLPDRQKLYTFTVSRRLPSTGAVVLGFKYVASDKPTVSWRGRCSTVDLGGTTIGRVWIDEATGAVTRIDEWLPRPFSYVMPLRLILDRHPMSQTVDRLETSIQYEPVKFRDPDETLMLPSSIRTLAVVHNSGMPQLLTLHTYDSYRRFMTGGRVVK